MWAKDWSIYCCSSLDGSGVIRAHVRACSLSHSWKLMFFLWFMPLMLLLCFRWWRTSAPLDLVWREWFGFLLCWLPSLFCCAGKVRAVSILSSRLEDLQPVSRYLPWACPREEAHDERRSLSSCSWTAVSGWAWFVDVSMSGEAASQAGWASTSACAGDCNCLDSVGGDWAGIQGEVSVVQLLWVSDWFDFCGQDVIGFCRAAEKWQWFGADGVSMVHRYHR